MNNMRGIEFQHTGGCAEVVPPLQGGGKLFWDIPTQGFTLGYHIRPLQGFNPTTPCFPVPSGLKARHVIARAEGPGTASRHFFKPCKGDTRDGKLPVAEWRAEVVPPLQGGGKLFWDIPTQGFTLGYHIKPLQGFNPTTPCFPVPSGLKARHVIARAEGPGWKQKTLEEIATTFGRGKSKHRPRNEPKLYGGKYPFIQTGDIRNADHFITEYSQTYSELGLAQSKLWPKGTICITIAAKIAETAILGFDACFPDSVIGVVANPKEAEVGFIEYLLQSFKARIQALGKGSAQANINMDTFENERFPFPPVAEQRQIVEKLDDLSEETHHLARLYERKVAALEALKKSLLHQAFTGEL